MEKTCHLESLIFPFRQSYSSLLYMNDVQSEEVNKQPKARHDASSESAEGIGGVDAGANLVDSSRSNAFTVLIFGAGGDITIPKGCTSRSTRFKAREEEELVVVWN